MSTLFLRTLREDPADAEVPSHRLLVRAGYVRRVSPGIFTWLPLGLRVLRNVEEIVRAEMLAAGFQEVQFPALLPREPYEQTGRWGDYGPLLFTLQDRRGADMLLGPTHEEMFTLLVKSEYSSYKDLPVSLFQIQTKYRDEARPRAGILRGREFIMKDSYSFDYTDEGLVRSYGQHRDAYIRTFEALGLNYVIAAATSGAMGGSASEEFLAPCASGEDTFVQCDSCDFVANVEALVTVVPPSSNKHHGEAFEIATPGVTAIDDLVTLVEEHPDLSGRDDIDAATMLKNIAFIVTDTDGSESPLVVGVPGDRVIDQKRLEAALAPAAVRAFTDADFAKYPQLVNGYLGPRRLGEGAGAGIRYLVDPRVVPGSAWFSGADRDGWHVVDVVVGRDFTPDGQIDVAEVRAGDLCSECGGALQISRGIEIGHIFQLGRKYAEALDLKVLDENGKQVVVTMGSYGIGVSRAVGAIAEQSHDERGLCWPAAVAPADVHVVCAGKTDEIREAAERVAEELCAAGFDVLLDDRRQASPGVKFKDAELIGVPTLVIVGKGVADGVVEIKDRKSMSSREVALDQVVAAWRVSSMAAATT